MSWGDVVRSSVVCNKHERKHEHMNRIKTHQTCILIKLNNLFSQVSRFVSALLSQTSHIYSPTSCSIVLSKYYTYERSVLLFRRVRLGEHYDRDHNRSWSQSSSSSPVSSSLPSWFIIAIDYQALLEWHEWGGVRLRLHVHIHDWLAYISTN